MTDEPMSEPMSVVVGKLIDRLVTAETDLAIQRARARYWHGAARRAQKAKTLEQARAILKAQENEDAGLICVQIN